MPAETASVHFSLRGSTSKKKKEAVQKWLHHISKEGRQEKKMAGLMSICSGGLERTGPTHAGLGPSLGFKGNIQLDFRLHSLRMLVWKQTSSGFEGMNSIIPITSP